MLSVLLPVLREIEPITPNTPKNWTRFTIGQTVLINGTEFKIRKITKKDIVLRPVDIRLNTGENDNTLNKERLRELRRAAEKLAGVTKRQNFSDRR